MGAVKAVGNIVTGSVDQTQTVLNCDALSHFDNLLNHQKEIIRKEAVWILSNVTAGNPAQFQAVIDAGLIPLIIHHLEKEELKTQKEATYAVYNLIFCGINEQIAYLVDCGVIPAFCNLLDCKDSPVLQVVLQGIHKVLKMSVNPDAGDKVCILIDECGGLDKIESLLHHENIAVCSTAYTIIKNYFLNNVCCLVDYN